MAINCGCVTPCNCVFADDGVVEVNGSYVVNTGQGRRNTVVSGDGSINNPITVSFIDSEFFRPEAGEFTFTNQSESSGSYEELDFVAGPANIIYQTPTDIFNTLISTIAFTVKGFFQFFGATAVFQSNTTGTRKLIISYDDGNLEQAAAGMTVDAPSESLTLTASGFYPGLFQPNASTPPVGFSKFRVYVWQDSGSALNLSNIKFWVGSL